jgi:hypothetical protein
MSLTRVTISGADDLVDPGRLAALAIEFPFVEWGILFSRKRAGEPRYPSDKWREWLQGVVKDVSMDLSAHFCGALARETLAGKGLHAELLTGEYGRIQLNGFESETEGLLRIIEDNPGHEWILQVRDRRSLQEAEGVCVVMSTNDLADVSILWDASGGRGLRSAWPSLQGFPVPVGLAGGIGPDNIEAVAREAAALPYVAWIDMESGVRTNDVFDLDKVKSVLRSAAPFVKELGEGK